MAKKTCPACKGSGQPNDSERRAGQEACGECGGMMWVEVPDKPKPRFMSSKLFKCFFPSIYTVLRRQLPEENIEAIADELAKAVTTDAKRMLDRAHTSWQPKEG